MTKIAPEKSTISPIFLMTGSLAHQSMGIGVKTRYASVDIFKVIVMKMSSLDNAGWQRSKRAVKRDSVR